MKKIPSGIACFACGAELSESRCGSCQHNYLMLGDVLCMSPVAEAQLRLWRHQLHAMQSASQETIDHYIDQLAHADVLPATAQRLEEKLEAAVLIRDFVLSLFAAVEVTPLHDPSLEGAPLGSLGEYHCHVARDWAWEEDVSGSCFEQLRTLQKSWPNNKRGKVLVLGSGAGRVAWDLHCALGNVETTTLDLNPVLQLLASQLIKGQPLPPFPETPVSPQAAMGTTFARWDLTPAKPVAEGLRDSFHQLIGDIWQLQFLAGTFDCIVTSWFVDVHGRDHREFIALLTRWLKPEGHWVNTGPLLYPESLAPEFKSNHQELKDFMALARFTLEQETAELHAHLPSPLSVKKQYEEIWTFCAKYEPDKRNHNNAFKQPDWLIMHYLPVVKDECKPVERNSVIDATLELVDGQRSINDIAAIMAPNLPDDVDIKRALVSFFAEMLPDH